jgi:PAS domain S-box-containing protein
VSLWAGISFLCTVSFFALGFIVYQLDPKRLLNRLFFIFCIIGAYLGFVELMIRQSESITTAHFWLRMGGLWPFIVAVLSHFILIFTGNVKALNNKATYVLIYGPALVFSVLLTVTPFFPGLPVKAYWGYTRGVPTSRIFAAVLGIWSGILPLIILGLVVHHFLKTADKIKKKQALFLFLGFLILLCMAFLSEVIAPALKLRIPELTTIGSLVMAGFIGFAMFRFQLFSINPALVADNIISTMGEALFLLDGEGKIISTNKACLDLLGYKKEELSGQSIKTIVAETVTKRTQFLDIIKTTPVKDYEITITTKDGRGIVVALSTSLLRDSRGSRAGTVCVARDITQQKTLEREKVAMQDQLLQAQKMEAIGTLTGGIAHDFNNLLNIIQGYTEMTMMQVEEKDELYPDLKRVFNACRRASRLTSQLLLFSRKQPMEMAKVNLNSLIKNLLKLMQRIIGENISMQTDLAPDLGPVMADEGNVEQVIMNLVINARDAIPRGGTIRLRTENREISEEASKHIQDGYAGRFSCIIVEDTGVGMDRTTVQHIFEPFFTTKGPGKGTGLGLSVAYGIIKQHQGWITVSSEPGKGSSFTVYLPLLGEESEEKAEKVRDLDGMLGKGERILLVEDESDLRRFTREALIKGGYTVVDTATAEEALDIFNQDKSGFDLVFSDIVLPKKSGQDLAEEILLKRPKQKMLFSSGYIDRKPKDDFFTKYGFTLLNKPYTFSRLLGEVKKALAK